MKTIYSILLVLGFTTCIACSKNKADKPKQSKTESITPEKKNELPLVTPTPPEHLKAAKEMIKNSSSADINIVDAALKYKMFCVACHGPKGDMNAMGAIDLTTSTVSLEERVAQIYFGKGLMTPFNELMSDAEILAVAKYLEGFR